MARRQKSESLRWQIIGAYENGQTMTLTSRLYCIAKGEVSRLVHKHQHTGLVADRPRSGHPRSHAHEHRRIVQHARRNRLKGARQIRDALQNDVGRLLKQTVNSRLIQARYHSHWTRKRLVLSPAHCRALLTWTKTSESEGVWCGLMRYGLTLHGWWLCKGSPSSRWGFKWWLYTAS